MSDNFWENWQWRKTEFESGRGFVELSFFSNNFQHCESTLTEACHRLGFGEFSIRAEKGGGYTGSIIFTPTDMESNNEQ